MFDMVIPGLKVFYIIFQPAKTIMKIFMWHEKNTIFSRGVKK